MVSPHGTSKLIFSKRHLQMIPSVKCETYGCARAAEGGLEGKGTLCLSHSNKLVIWKDLRGGGRILRPFGQGTGREHREYKVCPGLSRHSQILLPPPPSPLLPGSSVLPNKRKSSTVTAFTSCPHQASIPHHSTEMTPQEVIHDPTGSQT